MPLNSLHNVSLPSGPVNKVSLTEASLTFLTSFPAGRQKYVQQCSCANVASESGRRSQRRRFSNLPLVLSRQCRALHGSWLEGHGMVSAERLLAAHQF